MMARTAVRYMWSHYDHVNTIQDYTDYYDHENHKEKLDDSAFFRTQSYITELCYIKFLPNLLIRWFMSL